MGLADMRILLFMSPSTATRTALLVGMESLRSNSVLLELSFHLDTDSPDEAPQLSSYCGHNLWLVLPSCEESSIPQVQSVLRLPGDLFDFFAQAHLSFQQVSTAPRPELIGPRCLDDHTSEMGVTSLGDASAKTTLATGVLARHEAAVAHQLPGFREARDLSQFGHDRHRRDLEAHVEIARNASDAG